MLLMYILDFFATHAICTLRVMVCFYTSSRPQPEYVGAFVGTKIGNTRHLHGTYAVTAVVIPKRYQSPRKHCPSFSTIVGWDQVE